MKSLYACKYIDLCYIHDPLSILGLIFWNWAEADRFHILNKYSPYNFVADLSIPLPNLTNPKNIPLEDTCISVAENIIKKANKNNKRIAVLWSGGVDSTCIVAALILVGISKEQLLILCAPTSIEENFSGYNFLKKQYEVQTYTWDQSLSIYQNLGSDVYFIPGWCADQLFGSNINLRYPEQYTKPWKDGLKYIIANTIWNERNLITVTADEINNAIDVFEDYAKRLNIDLKYTCDALWLFNFGIKWSHVSRDLALTLNNEAQRNNIINFFDNINFQEWSLSNYQDFYKHNQAIDVQHYKRPLKELIYKVFKDNEYLKYKGKVNSWHSAFGPALKPKRFQYTTLAIWDTQDGILSYDLNIAPEYPTNEKDVILVQRRNRRRYLLPYLKKNIDQDHYLAADLW